MAQANQSPVTTIRDLIEACGLAGVLDLLGDEFPQYANDLHKIAEAATRDAELLAGKHRR